jgi:hypothetical protein
VNQRIESVQIVTGAHGGAGWVWITLLLGACVLAGGVGLAAWARWRSRRDPLDSAFASLARVMGLSRADREGLIAAAKVSGVPAGVLLVSASARGEAVRRAASSRGRAGVVA